MPHAGRLEYFRSVLETISGTVFFRADGEGPRLVYAPIIRQLQRDGYSMRGIAAELEKRKVQTPRGGAWHPCAMGVQDATDITMPRRSSKRN
jgi:hypothetical protein